MHDVLALFVAQYLQLCEERPHAHLLGAVCPGPSPPLPHAMVSCPWVSCHSLVAIGVGGGRPALCPYTHLQSPCRSKRPAMSVARGRRSIRVAPRRLSAIFGVREKPRIRLPARCRPRRRHATPEARPAAPAPRADVGSGSQETASPRVDSLGGGTHAHPESNEASFREIPAERRQGESGRQFVTGAQRRGRAKLPDPPSQVLLPPVMRWSRFVRSRAALVGSVGVVAKPLEVVIHQMRVSRGQARPHFQATPPTHRLHTKAPCGLDLSTYPGGPHSRATRKHKIRWCSVPQLVIVMQR